MTHAVIFNACGYCCDLMQSEKVLRQGIKISYNSAMYQQTVQLSNVLR